MGMGVAEGMGGNPVVHEGGPDESIQGYSPASAASHRKIHPVEGVKDCG